MKSSQNLPAKLKEYRKKNHYSQEQLAEQMNLSRQAISNWETGKATPDIDNLVMLSELYGIPVDVLLGEDDRAKVTTDNTSLIPDNYISILEMLTLSVILILSLEFLLGGIFAAILTLCWLKRTKRNYFIIYIICGICFILEIYDLIVFVSHIKDYLGFCEILLV